MVLMEVTKGKCSPGCCCSLNGWRAFGVVGFIGEGWRYSLFDVMCAGILGVVR